MLSHAADRVGRGRAFGLHEALDQTGAMLGPLIVAAVLASGGTYRVSFAALAVPAVLALSLLVVTQRIFPHPERLAPPSRDAGDAPLPRTFWIFLTGMALLGAGTADFALIGFHMVRSAGLSPAWAPVAFAAAMALQGLSSLLAGRLFDRVGVPALALLAVPAAAFAPLVFLGKTPALAAGVVCWALGMGAQSTVMKAFVARTVAAGRRGAAYGVMNAGYGLAWFAGSALMGFLYDRSRAALCAFSIAAQAAAVATLLAANAAAKKPT
jgi:MFS family permease